jgi:hypothetical protein
VLGTGAHSIPQDDLSVSCYRQPNGLGIWELKFKTHYAIPHTRYCVMFLISILSDASAWLRSRVFAPKCEFTLSDGFYSLQCHSEMDDKTFPWCCATVAQIVSDVLIGSPSLQHLAYWSVRFCPFFELLHLTSVLCCRSLTHRIYSYFIEYFSFIFLLILRSFKLPHQSIRF